MGNVQYSDDVKAAVLTVLDENQGNIAETSRLTNVPYTTIVGWRDGLGICPVVTEIRNGKKGALADRYEETIQKIVDALDPKIGEASLKDAVVSIGVLTDKMRLLRDESTSINQTRRDTTHTERVQALIGILYGEDGEAVQSALPASESGDVYLLGSEDQDKG